MPSSAALKQNIFKRQRRTRLIELSALSAGAQQLKSVPYLGRKIEAEQKNLGAVSPTDMGSNE